MRRLLALGVGASCLLVGAHASASPLFELVGGTLGPGGFNARVTGADAHSTYFNPSLLPHAEQGFGLGFLVVSDQISLTLDGRPSGNVPLRVGERGIVDGAGVPIPDDTVPTDWLENGCDTGTCAPPFRPRPRQADGSSGNTNGYVIIGLVSELIEERLVIGLHSIIPAGSFTTANAYHVDERAQFFSNSLHPELYSDRMTPTSLAFGVGSQIIDQLSAGLSFTLNLENIANAGTYVPDSTNYDALELSTDVEVKAGVSPHFGLTFTPTEKIAVSGTVHSPQKLEIVTKFGAALPAGAESDTTRRAVHDYLPWQFALGGDIEITDNIGVVATAGYALWSQYEDRQGASPDDYSEGGVDLGWSDVPFFSVGGRLSVSDLNAFLDLSFQPSPVPEQVGRSNYVDNDRYGAVTGADYSFTLWDLEFRPGVQAFVHMLPERYHEKRDDLIRDELPDDAVDAQTGDAIPGRDGLQTNNPGWPGFASDGWIYGGAVTMTLHY